MKKSTTSVALMVAIRSATTGLKGPRFTKAATGDRRQHQQRDADGDVESAGCNVF